MKEFSPENMFKFLDKVAKHFKEKEDVGFNLSFDEYDIFTEAVDLLEGLAELKIQVEAEGQLTTSLLNSKKKDIN